MSAMDMSDEMRKLNGLGELLFGRALHRPLPSSHLSSAITDAETVT